MKTTRTTLAAITALTIILGFGALDRAEAAIRVQATLRTPNVDIVIGNRPAVRRVLPLRPLPVRAHLQAAVTRRDARIARRLARYTGVSRGEILRARRMGYTWREIGRWLDVPVRVLDAAMSSREWNRTQSCGRHGTVAIRGRGHNGHHSR